MSHDWNEIWGNVDPELRERAVNHLRDKMDHYSLVQIKAAILEYGSREWVHELMFHMFGGTAVRNLLREVIGDGELPAVDYGGGQSYHNWDDYYVQALEEAVEPIPINEAFPHRSSVREQRDVIAEIFSEEGTEGPIPGDYRDPGSKWNLEAEAMRDLPPEAEESGLDQVILADLQQALNLIVQYQRYLRIIMQTDTLAEQARPLLAKYRIRGIDPLTAEDFEAIARNEGMLTPEEIAEAEARLQRSSFPDFMVD